MGNDYDRKILLKYLNESAISTELIQVNNEYPTGLVNVVLNEKGNASYDINYPSAWDKIELSAENTAIVKNADFFVFFGSLSSRDAVSANTLKQLLSVEQSIKFISEKTSTKTVCVTLGAHGAIIYFENKFYRNLGFKVNVVDTVGSGDSFLAALIVKLLSENNPQFAIDFA